MRIDAITIFPDYFAPLQLSLLGKAQDGGLLSVNVHDLRSQTSDTHHTVDDTPYGGGAGMVMLADVWGKAIDSVIEDGAILIVLTPAGRRFNQEMAEELSRAPHLIFACGRYEGIDDRVRIHYSQS
jgi:tRNA (guanine37-N1)-methyltransferase